jgi:hypothetical protein
MNTDRFRFGVPLNRRVITAMIAAVLLLSACGNSAGTTPNTQNGGGGNGNGIASPLESVPPDIPRTVK